MPIPRELTPFFNRLVEKSKRLEINWEGNGRRGSYRVRFPDFSIEVAQDGHASPVRIQLRNGDGHATSDFRVSDRDDEWIGAVALVNSADRKVHKAGETLRRAMEELGRPGAIGISVSR